MKILRMKIFRHRVPTVRLSAWLVLALLFLAGCWGGERPQVSLEVPTTEIPLPYGALVVVPMSMRCLEQLPEGPMTFFIHLLNEAGEIVRTFDRPFSVARVKGCLITTPITLWQSALSEPLPAGRYPLRIGVVDESRRRLVLAIDGVQGHRGAYKVAEVVVPEPSSDLPSLSFVGSWKQPAAAEERQLPGNRWLEGKGELWVHGLSEQRSLRMSVRLLDAEEHDLRVVFAEGQRRPNFTIIAGCNSGRGKFGGALSHDLRVSLLPTSFPADCPVRFEPNFTLIDPKTLERGTLGLERLTWIDMVLIEEDEQAAGAKQVPPPEPAP